MTRTKRKPVSPGSDRRSVTVTFGYGGDDLRVIVASTLRDAFADALRRWGEWETLESISTPDTIYADLTGETKAQWGKREKDSGWPNTEAAKLRRALGREPRAGEIGAYRRVIDELPNLIPRPFGWTCEPSPHFRHKQFHHRGNGR